MKQSVEDKIKRQIEERKANAMNGNNARAKEEADEEQKRYSFIAV